jgi:crossover junction endodeoxyribonuclease RuvC
MITVGVDPGLSGAVAILRDGSELVTLIDMPVVQSGGGGSKVQKMVDGSALYKALAEKPIHAKYVNGTGPIGETIYALVERTTAMPGQGVSSMYSMGHSRGVVEGVLGALGIETFLVPAAVWKRHMGYTANKEPIRAEMRRVFPTAELNLKKHADRAEALAMALYLYRQKK